MHTITIFLTTIVALVFLFIMYIETFATTSRCTAKLYSGASDTSFHLFSL